MHPPLFEFNSKALDIRLTVKTGEVDMHRAVTVDHTKRGTVPCHDAVLVDNFTVVYLQRRMDIKMLSPYIQVQPILLDSTE